MRLDEYQRIHDLELTHWWYRTLHAIALDSIRRYAPTDATVLDAGCGAGGFLFRLGESCRRLGVDMHPEALRLTRERSRVPVCRARVEALPFPEDSVDVVVSLDVIYHAAVPNAADAIVEMARVLKPGGLFVLNVPAYEALRSGHDAAIHTARRFSRFEVWRLLETAGLEPMRVSHWNSALFPAAAVVRLWRRNRQDSDLQEPGVWSNWLFGKILDMERRLSSAIELPFGLSIFAVARKEMVP